MKGAPATHGEEDGQHSRGWPRHIPDALILRRYGAKNAKRPRPRCPR